MRLHYTSSNKNFIESFTFDPKTASDFAYGKDISTILQNIGLNVQTIVSYLSNLIPSSLGVDRIAQEFMQQVSINADFPNVTDSNEIMEAFEMMENEASQYASRKTV